MVTQSSGNEQNLNRLMSWFVVVCSIVFIGFSNKLYTFQSDWEVEIIDNPSPGFLSFNWNVDSSFNLMDNYSTFKFPKVDTVSNHPFKLLKNKLWISFTNNKYYLYNEEFKLVDSIPHPENYDIDFHDVTLLNNGHYLLLCKETRIMDLSKIIQGGKNDARLIANILIETDTDGKIYWTWHALDHYDILDYPIEEDLTKQSIDFTHANSVIEDNDGNILISMRSLDEVTKINKSTGEFIWRFGGKLNKKNQFRYLNDTVDGFWGFSHQHSISIMPNGNLLLFDNGNLKSNKYSRAVEYKLDFQNKTALKTWEYRPETDVFISSMGSVSRLLNGNYLINFSNMSNSTILLEVRPDNSIAFKLNFNGMKRTTFLTATRNITNMDAVLLNINSNANYSFNNDKYNTGVDLQILEFNGTTPLISVEKYRYSPPVVKLSDSNQFSILPNRWVISKQNLNSFKGIFKLNTNILNDIKYPEKLKIYFRPIETKGEFHPLQTSYNQLTRVLSAPINSNGEYILASTSLNVPKLTFPFNNQKINTPNNKLRWDSVLYSKGYHIQLSESMEMKDNLIDVYKDGDNLFYDFTNLKTGNSYYWRVRAYNHIDTSDWSYINLFTIVENIFFTPELIEPINNSIKIKLNDTLKWYQVPFALSYKIELSPDSLFKISNSLSYSSAKNYLVLDNVESFRDYYWRVKAFNNTDSTEWSEIWMFTSNIKSPELTLPFDKSFNIPTRTNLNWELVNEVEKYHLQISLNQNFENSIIDTILHDKDYFEIIDLDYKTEYFWRIKSIRFLDSSDWSIVFSFNTILQAPVLIFPTYNQKGVDLDLELLWSKFDSDETFDLQVADNIDFQNPILDMKNINSDKYLLKNLENNKKYFWRLILNIGNKKSDWTDISTFTTEMVKPEIISPNPNQTNVPIQVQLKWNDINVNNFYRIQIALDSIFSNILIDESNLTQKEYEVNLNSMTVYYFRVKTENEMNFSDWSEIIEFKTLDVASVLDSEINSINVFPNPARNFLIINQNDISMGSDAGEILIINSIGNTILRINQFKTNSDNIKIDISSLPNGIYFIRLNKFYGKFIKN